MDEVFRILNYIASTQPLGRAYKVTDELFDLSTMAMEYFKENIEPTLPEITYFGSDFLEFTPPFATPSKRLGSSSIGFDSPMSSRASAVGSSCSEPPLPYNARECRRLLWCFYHFLTKYFPFSRGGLRGVWELRAGGRPSEQHGPQEENPQDPRRDEEIQHSARWG